MASPSKNVHDSIVASPSKEIRRESQMSPEVTRHDMKRKRLDIPLGIDTFDIILEQKKVWIDKSLSKSLCILIHKL